MSLDHPTLCHFFQSCVQFKQREWNRIDNKEEGGGLEEKVNRFGVRSDTPSLEEVRKEGGRKIGSGHRATEPSIDHRWARK